MGKANADSRWAYALHREVAYFNGSLFLDTRVYELARAERGELLRAAQHEWKNVEPAIFGTLLEQALTPGERAKLGAHYTPRPYVERIVEATITDVLRPEWETIETGLEGLPTEDALVRLHAYHNRLAALSILDPACGTGNFLYVAMEALLGLENKVIQAIEDLGGEVRSRIGPGQFHGLEKNPRAAKIAELVLWIGWLRWNIRNGAGEIMEPILGQRANINFGKPGGYDAVLAQDETSAPDFGNPRQPDWPEANFIVGNPPFIGGKDIRAELGGDYAEALWRANPTVPASADFVMQWWDRAARELTTTGTRLKRFGFVTTNSITQAFSRRAIERYLAGSAAEGADGLHLLLACPDHPWTKATKDAAAVRIAMTVAEAGAGDGTLLQVEHEAKLDSDTPELRFSATQARINANLTVGDDPSVARVLSSNEGLSSRGMSLHGDGFIVSPSEAETLGLGRREGLEQHIRPYRNGRDLLGNSRGKMVIDLFGLTEKEVRLRFPEVYQHLLVRVWDYQVYHKQKGQSEPKGRKYNNRETYKVNWWLFGEPRRELRPALVGLARYIATVETAKHRVFQFLDANILPDNKLVLIGSDDPFHLGVLCSRTHVQWSLRAGGWLGVGNDSVYVKSKVFDPFPFPDPSAEQRIRIADLAEELDATRKLALAEVPRLTMTEIYNLRERIAAGDQLNPSDLARATAARAFIVHQLHGKLDGAVAEAYGFPANLAPSEIVARLVALNAERKAEEEAGHIRWLRPEYQSARFGKGEDQ